MKRCTAVARSTCSWQARRWASHKKENLTREALRSQVEAGLGNDASGKPIQLDETNKTIPTAYGDLPISPVFDPAWIQSRRRQTKADPKPTGRFRRKLRLNPYARILATPIRQCTLTKATMPRYLLQDFEIVKNPETDKPWYVPGQAATERLQKSQTEETNEEAEQEDTDNLDGGKPRPRRAPITTFALCSKPLMDKMGSFFREAGDLLGQRTGIGVAQSLRRAVFREDMSEYILDTYRRTIVDYLLERTTRTQEGGKLVEPVNSWDEIKNVGHRESILWIPRQENSGEDHATANLDASSQSPAYATFDIGDVAYKRKMVVHNLPWLLGKDGVARLQEGAPHVFAKHDLFVLRLWSNRTITHLHMLLWRLHGYISKRQVERPA